MTRHSCSNPIPLRYECLLQRQRNRSKATMCYWRMPKMFLVDGRLCVSCYYPTTCTDYPSTTKGTSVGPPVAVNINFWALVLPELYGYSTPMTTFLVNNWSSLQRSVLIFQPTVNCRASDKQGELCPEQHYSLTELRSSCVDIWIRVSGGVQKVEGVHSGYIEKPWPSWILQLTKTLRYFR
jgi:hypothetical protein